MDPRHWTTLCLCLVVLAFLLQMAGYVTPFWVWVQKDGQYVGISTWYQIKSDNITAVTNAVATIVAKDAFPLDQDAYWNQANFNAMRGLETSGSAGALILVIFLVVYRIGMYTWSGMRSLNLLTTVVALLTLLAIAAGVIVFCAAYWNVVGSSPRVSPTSFPWSLLFCFAASLLLLMVAVLMRTKCRPRKTDVALPVSGDAKMGLHPTTKNGANQRYFTPSPYSEDRRSNYHGSAYYSEDGVKRSLIGDDKAGSSMFENRGFRQDPPDRFQDQGPSRHRDSQRMLSEFPRGPRYGGGDVERVTASPRYVTTDIDRDIRPAQNSGLPRSRGSDANPYYNHLQRSSPSPGLQTDSGDIIYTGKSNVYAVPDNYGYAGREMTAPVPPMPRNERDVTRFSGDGRMVAQSHVYDLRPSEYGADAAAERSVHMDRTRGMSGAKMVLPSRGDFSRNGDPTRGASSSGYVYRPYADLKY